MSKRDHRRAYAWIRAALVLGVPSEDYDATIFKLVLIAGRLGIVKLGSAERLTARITAGVTSRCESSFELYADISAMGR